jgi:hypothetical protein
MKTFGVARYALTVSTAAALLTGCGRSQPPIGAPGAMSQSLSVKHADNRVAQTYLYVADPALHGVVAFDASGNKVAERLFNRLAPVDIVTDTRGHVYTIVFSKKNSSTVLEFTHDLDRQIAEYHPPAFSYAMTVDADDNLYVGSETAGGFHQAIVRYPYGSTEVAHTYDLGYAPGTSNLAGISIRGKILYAMFVPSAGSPWPPTVMHCSVNGAGRCLESKRPRPGTAKCGFAISNRHLVFGEWNGIEYDTIGKDWSRHRHDIALPAGYSLGDGNCHFHSYKSAVWVVVQSSSGPAEALDVDIDRGKVISTVGAGYLKAPNAAYYGNGFIP